MALTKDERELVNSSIKAYKKMIKHIRGQIKQLEKQKLPDENENDIPGAEIGKTKKR